jgi:hypothetical protein
VRQVQSNSTLKVPVFLDYQMLFFQMLFLGEESELPSVTRIQRPNPNGTLIGEIATGPVPVDNLEQAFTIRADGA